MGTDEQQQVEAAARASQGEGPDSPCGHVGYDGFLAGAAWQAARYAPLVEAAQRVDEAIAMEGSHPELHRAQIARLKAEWATLYYSIVSLRDALAELGETEAAPRRVKPERLIGPPPIELGEQGQ